MIWKAGLLAATLCALGVGTARANEYEIIYQGLFYDRDSTAVSNFELDILFDTTQAGAHNSYSQYRSDSPTPPDTDVYGFRGSFTVGSTTISYNDYSYTATPTTLTLEDFNDYPPVIGSLDLTAFNSANATEFGQDYHTSTGGGTIDYDGVDLTNESDPMQLHFHGSFVADEVDHITLSAAPEPSTWALMLAGVSLAGAALRARRRTALA